MIRQCLGPTGWRHLRSSQALVIKTPRHWPRSSLARPPEPLGEPRHQDWRSLTESRQAEVPRRRSVVSPSPRSSPRTLERCRLRGLPILRAYSTHLAMAQVPTDSTLSRGSHFAQALVGRRPLAPSRDQGGRHGNTGRDHDRDDGKEPSNIRNLQPTNDPECGHQPGDGEHDRADALAWISITHLDYHGVSVQPRWLLQIEARPARGVTGCVPHLPSCPSRGSAERTSACSLERPIGTLRSSRSGDAAARSDRSKFSAASDVRGELRLPVFRTTNKITAVAHTAVPRAAVDKDATFWLPENDLWSNFASS